MGEELPTVAPVESKERHGALDALRGFALLGILPMNVFTGLPAAAFFNPTVAGGFTGVNYWLWLFGEMFFNLKMMSIFSMLFGAGMVLTSDRAADRGRSPTRMFLRRTAVLLVFGLLHAYFLFEGDILYCYAMTSLLVFWFRNRSPRTLLILGVLALVPGMVMTSGAGLFFGYARGVSQRVTAMQQRGETPMAQDVEISKAWDEMSKDFNPTPEKAAKELQVRQHGSYWEVTKDRAEAALAFQTTVFVTMLLWATAGRMLIGMSLMKRGVWTGERTARFYWTLAACGYGIGLPLVGYGAYRMQRHDFDFVAAFRTDLAFNAVGSLFVAFGHAGVLLGSWKAGAFGWLMRRFEAVGRMALSNYLMQSVFMLTFFHFLGMFARCERWQLWLFCLAVWALQLAYSPLWLSHFRFGPFEWLWRSLTYGRRQPMLAR